MTYTITVHNMHVPGSDYPITVSDISDSYLGSSSANPQILDCFKYVSTNGPFTGTLAAGEAAQCTYQRVISINDPDPLITTASVTGVMNGSGNGAAVEDSTRVSVAVTASQLLVRKTASTTVAQPGDEVSYRIAITNIGKTNVVNLTATDPELLEGGVPKVWTRVDSNGNPLPLAPYQTQFYNYTLTMPLADSNGNVARDPFINTVTVEGDVLGPDGQPIPVVGQPHTLRVEATASVDILQSAMRVSKRAQEGAATRGSTAKYDVTILNTGDTPITNIVVTDVTGNVQFTLDVVHCPELDPDPAVDTCGFAYTTPTSPRYLQSYDPIAGVPAGEEITGTVAVVVNPPIDANEFTNIVEVTANIGATSVRDRSSATIDVREEGIGVVKVASVPAAPVGGTILYTVTVTNTGSENAKIDRLVFFDPHMPAGTTTTYEDTDLSPDGFLDLGESFTLPSYSYKLKLSDTNPFVNQVTVSAHTTTGATVIGTAQTSVEVQPVQVDVEKFACVGTDPDAGIEDSTMLDPCVHVLNAASATRTVTYYLHISNPGALPIHNITVSDPTAVPGDIAAINTLLSGRELADNGGDVWVKYLVTVPTTATDPYQNVVTVSAQAPIDPENPNDPPLTVFDSARATVNLVSSDLYLTKSANVTQGIVGSNVIYTLTIQNLAPLAGGQTIDQIQVSDPMNSDPASDCNTLATSLAAGVSDSCTFTHTLALSDPSPLINTAFAQGLQNGVLVTDEASATVSINRPGGLSIEKIADQTTAAIGDTVFFTYIIRNTGMLQLTNLTITELDPDVSAFDVTPPTTLIPSQQVILRASRTITVADFRPVYQYGECVRNSYDGSGHSDLYGGKHRADLHLEHESRRLEHAADQLRASG